MENLCSSLLTALPEIVPLMNGGVWKIAFALSMGSLRFSSRGRLFLLRLFARSLVRSMPSRFFAARDGVVEDLANEGQMPIERAATDPALGLLDRSPFLAKLLDGELLVPGRFAVVLVDIETEEIDELADLRLVQKAQIVNALVLDVKPNEQNRRWG